MNAMDDLVCVLLRTPSGLMVRVHSDAVESFVAACPVATMAPMDGEHVTVRWEFWKMTQSQFHSRVSGSVDLGPLD